ncbi:protein CEBPZOS [Aricia agestis]|uniref:protein CEBPZOS n=1 Tax=Aricia agestis TaxID=91739 RepID=UPI001C202467|nr:protein CEBPZOS [Aricia agestis]XP_041986447.1 protein CEBPZOS [Aricia agestis]XP_041986454.1 protein CEBPZOS [Aricia agestis]
MLEKKPSPSYKRWLGTTAKTIFVAEVVGFAFSYGIWYKLNTERDFRLYMHKNLNWVLEGYYRLGEVIADHKTRELDKKIWTQEGKI